jgi:hypothetical protein
MDDSMDFDFHHPFLITSVLFITSILAQLVDRERVASNGGKVC